MRRRLTALVALSLAGSYLAGCGPRRESGDFVVVVSGASGEPTHCFRLSQASVVTDRSRGQVMWLTGEQEYAFDIGHVKKERVRGGDFDAAIKAFGLDPGLCTEGVYPDLAAAARRAAEELSRQAARKIEQLGAQAGKALQELLKEK
jgi:hypothetical protein